MVCGVGVLDRACESPAAAAVGPAKDEEENCGLKSRMVGK